MKHLLALLITLMASQSFAGNFMSAAVCYPHDRASAYNHIEVFYDDDNTAFFIGDLRFAGAPESMRMGRPVIADDQGDFLRIYDDENSLDIRIKKNDPKYVFELMGSRFSCPKSDW